jgi:hypothetical protein
MSSHFDGRAVVRVPQGRVGRRLVRRLSLAVALVASVLATSVAGAAASHGNKAPAPPDFGPNVVIIDPSMSTSQIKTIVDGISTQQIPNQFGDARYEILFKPGTYGTATTGGPLNFQVGYYTDVAGLGALPTDVTINGTIDVYNQCHVEPTPTNPTAIKCTALVNFWRSISNLTINVAGKGGCQSGEFWAVSQATSMRRVNVNGNTTLMDYCTGPSYASGGFIADSQLQKVTNGSQQQWFTRNSSVNPFTNGVWNQVFAGVTGAPDQSFPTPPYTTLATNPESREKPFLYVDSTGAFNVYVPDAQFNSSGPTWTAGQTPGHSLPISDFFIAKPTDSVQTINNALARGKNLIFTPGIYNVSRTIEVKRPDTIVLGMGLATITPQNGVIPMTVADVKGVEISDLIFDAGPVNSPVLLQVGSQHARNGHHGHHGHHAREHNHWSDPTDPSVLSDVYFRIGGAHAGKATTSLVVNANNVVLDNIWAWRADHGTGVGWTSNTAETGLIVNGDNVVATGLFVEHYQKDEVIWNGQNGKIVFFQNEMPYDPPSQAAWTQPDGTLGYPAIHVTSHVQSFQAWGIGSYSYFNQGVNIYSANAFVVPTTLAPGSIHDALTIFLSTAGFGGIQNVINGTGGSSTIANPDTVVPVVSYP